MVFMRRWVLTTLSSINREITTRIASESNIRLSIALAVREELKYINRLVYHHFIALFNGFLYEC